MTNQAAGRGRFQGVGQIVRYNGPSYGFTLAGITAAFLLALRAPAPWRVLLAAGASVPAFWLCASLAVSHYIYDRFPIYDLVWLARGLGRRPRRWVNIHAGLDETSHVLAAMFGDSRGNSLDIYDPTEMTEHSIGRARRCSGTAGSSPASWRNLPLPDGTCDAVFAIFAAHELRRRAARARFFRETARVLAPAGELVLVEHLRDWPNFLAFGPGFFHFFSERAWRSAAESAGMVVRQRISLTPFVSAFFLRRAA